MRWVVVALGFVAGAAGCLPRPPVPSLVAEPRVEVAAAVFDFGQVSVGEVVRHVFPVANRGRQPLTLEPARTECACITSVSPGGTVAAGDSGWVEVLFDTTGTAGERARTVIIETNDPKRPELMLTVRGTVVADVRVSPDRVFFGRVRRGVAREMTVDIETAPGVTIEKVRKESHRFDVRFVRRAAPATGIRLHVKLEPQTQRGPFDDTLLVLTNSKRQSEIEIPVFGFIE